MSNKHMPQPSMIQHHCISSQYMCLNHVPTCTMHQHVPQLVPSSAWTMYHKKCMNYVPKQVYQSCTNHVPVPYTIPCSNHANQPCTSTMHINTYTLYHTMCQPWNVLHIPYQAPNLYYTMYHKICWTSNTKSVFQPSTITTKRCLLCMYYHMPSVYLNNVSISMVYYWHDNHTPCTNVPVMYLTQHVPYTMKCL